MNKTFTINGNKYKAKEFDFELVCDLEDMGLSIDEMGKKPLSATRSYFALCAGLNKSTAAKEIQNHLIAGGTLEELNNVVSEAIENSDFFQAISKTAEETDAENQAEETAEIKKK